MRQILSLLIFCLAVGSFQSCVSKKKYDDLVTAKQATDQALAETQERVKTLEEEKTALETEFEAEKNKLNSKIDGISADLQSTKSEMEKVKGELTATQEELEKVKNEINGIFAAYKDSGLALEEKNGKLLIVTSENVKYKSGSTRLSKAERKALDELAETLKNNPKVSVLIEGHTDSDKLIEGAAYSDNWELSTARAVGVIRYLVKQGVNPDQLAAVGRGENEPIGDNETSDGKAENRRTIVAPDADLSNLMKN